VIKQEPTITDLLLLMVKRRELQCQRCLSHDILVTDSQHPLGSNKAICYWCRTEVQP
jgi:hypothetical protein